MFVEVVRDDRRLEALRRQWRSLVARCLEKSVFMTWEWLYSWWQHFSARRRLFVLAVWDSGRLEGIVPLTRRLRPGGPRGEGWCLEFLGYREGIGAADWMDVVAIRKEEVLNAALRYLLRRPHLWEWIELHAVPEDSSTIGVFRKLAHTYRLDVTVAAEDVYPYVSTMGDWSSYYTRCSVRGDTDRQIRRLSQQGRLEAVFADQRAVGRHLEDLFALHRKRQAALGRASMFSEEVYRSFYWALARNCPAEWLDCSVLRLNGTAVAAHFGFRYGGKFYWLTPAFDPAYGNFSPGRVLLRYLIERCFDSADLLEFDFLRGNEPYKRQWADGERRGCRIVIRNPVAERAVGRMAFATMQSARRWLAVASGRWRKRRPMDSV